MTVDADGIDLLALKHWAETVTGAHGLHTGGSLCVVIDGETVTDIGFGVDHRERPVRPDSLVPLYCAGKPVVAVGVLCLVQDGDLSLDDQLGHVLNNLPDWLARTTIEMLLTHSAGLHDIDLVTARLMTDTARRELVRMLPPPVGWRQGDDHAYATYGAWHFLGEVIEVITQRPFDQALTARVLEPYGICSSDYIVRFSPETHAREAHRISVTIDLGDGSGVPLLAEAGPETSCEWNPAYGAYATMSALAGLWNGVLGDLGGASRVLEIDGARQATISRTGEWYDEALSRPARFGLGIMTDLEAVLSPRLSAGTFGHTGLEGCAFGLADPSRHLVMSAAFNGLADLESVQLLRRGPLIERVCTAVDGLS